jgi:hypothetical protein
LLGRAIDAFSVYPQDAQGKGIGENSTVLQHLMSGAVKGRS